jgi:hypothetical protein
MEPCVCMVLDNSCRDLQRVLSLGLDCPDFDVIERVSQTSEKMKFGLRLRSTRSTRHNFPS